MADAWSRTVEEDHVVFSVPAMLHQAASSPLGSGEATAISVYVIIRGYVLAGSFARLATQ